MHEFRAAPNEIAVAGAVVALMREAHGLDIACYAAPFLAASIERRRDSAAGESTAAYCQRLAWDRPEAQALSGCLDIHHSEFFRDPLAFALLEQHVLPNLVLRMEAAGRTELRVWSAGCAGGHEAYSLAILLSELSIRRDRPLRFRLFATDRSAAEIALARSGVYSEANLANVRFRQLQRWFQRSGDAFVVRPELRDHTDFSVYDLLGEHSNCPPASIFGSFDLILCCNVLFYYHVESSQRILEKLRRSLAPGGYLVTGDAERDMPLSAGLRATALHAPIFQERRRY